MHPESSESASFTQWGTGTTNTGARTEAWPAQPPGSDANNGLDIVFDYHIYQAHAGGERIQGASSRLAGQSRREVTAHIQVPTGQVVPTPTGW